MLSLTRTVRFSINPDPVPWGDPTNTFAAFPTMRGLGRHYELDICCRGDVDPRAGYFVNIKAIDAAVRAVAIPAIERACRDRPAAEAADVLHDFMAPLHAALDARLAAVRWRLSPYHSVEMAPSAPSRVLIRQQFEFAASHRLHLPELSDQQNRESFGKCNSPAGHGHNYRVEPCVEVDLDAGGPRYTLAALEHDTQRTIINRFDHKHLNQDAPEFAVESGKGFNPTVENIARVCFDLLAPAISSSSRSAANLRSVTVWETDKTCCTYPA